MTKGYFKKTIIYSEEEIDGPDGKHHLIRGSFETVEDITDQKEELIASYGHF